MPSLFGFFSLFLSFSLGFQFYNLFLKVRTLYICLIYILNSFSKDLILYSIYNLSAMQQILNNKNIGFDFFSFWRTERIKTSVGLVSITCITTGPWGFCESWNEFTFSHWYAKEQMSHPNRLLKLVDDFLTIDVNSGKHLHTFINYLLEMDNTQLRLSYILNENKFIFL